MSFEQNTTCDDLLIASDVLSESGFESVAKLLKFIRFGQVMVINSDLPGSVRDGIQIHCEKCGDIWWQFQSDELVRVFEELQVTEYVVG